MFTGDRRESNIANSQKSIPTNNGNWETNELVNFWCDTSDSSINTSH